MTKLLSKFTVGDTLVRFDAPAEALAEKGGIDAVRAVAFAYDIYTNPSKNNGVLRPTLAALIETPLQEPRGSAIRNQGGFIVLA
jgi:hypothetical protein